MNRYGSIWKILSEPLNRPGIRKYSQERMPNSYAPQMQRSGFHVAKMTSATASQPSASMVELVSQRPSMYSMT